MSYPLGMRKLTWLFACVGAIASGHAVLSCSASSSDPILDGGAGAGGASMDASSGGKAGTAGKGGDAGPCEPYRCSTDHKRIEDCDGVIVDSCGFDELCANAECLPACEASEILRTSVGCEYYPVQMAAADWTEANWGCFAVFIANTWGEAAHIEVDRKGTALDPGKFAYLPSGSGDSITYEPYDPVKGLAPNKVAILFLAGPPTPNPNKVSVECPFGVTPAVIDDGTVQISGTGVGNAFHITSDRPVVAYQMLPYGGGSAAVTGASLLLPTSVWDTNYVAVDAYGKSGGSFPLTRPSLNLIAKEDGTQVTLLPRVAVEGGKEIPEGEANKVLTFSLNKGQYAQITQSEELTGSPIQSNKPIGLMAGHECMFVPDDVQFCDHAEQQIPPVKAMANEYVAVPYRPRAGGSEQVPWRIVSGVDGTQLTFDPPTVHADQTLAGGEVLNLTASEPFVVKSQDESHPFLIMAYMTGAKKASDYGDPDFVRMVPPRQYLTHYVFFTDPSYPETNLVLVRNKGDKGFSEVELECAGVVSGWQPVGASGMYEYTRVDLVRHNFEGQNGCNNGRQDIQSEVPFGLWVWGWGSPETQSTTVNVSYGYPAGENVVQLNNIILPVNPK